MDVKTVCLGVLTLGDASGYEIRKSFEDGPFRYFTDAGFGSIYPALNRLRRDGLVTCEEHAQDGRPDKKVYSITEAGRAALQEALLASPARDRVRSDFLFMLFFADQVSPRRLARLIDERIAWYRDNLTRMEACDCDPTASGPAFVRGLGIAVYRAAAEYLEANRDELLDRLSPRAEPKRIAG